MKYNISIFDTYYYNLKHDVLWVLRGKNLETIISEHFEHPSFAKISIAQATHLFNKWSYDFVVYLDNIKNRDGIFDSETLRGKRTRVIICDVESFSSNPSFFEEAQLSRPISTEEFYNNITKTHRTQDYIDGLIEGFGMIKFKDNRQARAVSSEYIRGVKDGEELFNKYTSQFSIE